jgi:hypothetical protein
MDLLTGLNNAPSQKNYLFGIKEHLLEMNM